MAAAAAAPSAAPPTVGDAKCVEEYVGDEADPSDGASLPFDDPDTELLGGSAADMPAPPPAHVPKRSRYGSPALPRDSARCSGPAAAAEMLVEPGGSGQPAEADDPVPQLNIFAEPDADALAAVLGRGFGAAEWKQVWELRTVSRGCRSAVCSDELWKRLFEQLRAGKVHTPPAIRSLLQLGRHTRAEQLRRRPDLRIGVYFEAFMLGIREPSRAIAEVEDMDGLEFHVRLKETAGTPEELKQFCPWWRGEPARRNRFAASTMVVLEHDAGRWLEMRSCPWEFVPAPPGCEGQHVSTTHPSTGARVVWKVRRHPNWGWLMISTAAIKSLFVFARPDETPAQGCVISAEQMSLSEAEAAAMDDAAEAMSK